MTTSFYCYQGLGLLFVVAVIVFCSVLQSQAVSGNVQGLLSNPVALPDLNFTGTENSTC